MGKGFKLPKWAVMIMAACFYLPLAVDWFPPGDGLHLAVVWLGGVEGVRALPTWGWLVRQAGKDIGALTGISVCAGIVCAWFAAAIAGVVFDAAVRRAKAKGVTDDVGLAWVRNGAVLLSGLSFVLTPGFLAGATRVSPLMVGFVPLLAVAWLVVCVLYGGACASTTTEDSQGKRDWTRPMLAFLLVLLVTPLLAFYLDHEFFQAREAIQSALLPALSVWLCVGVLPMLAIARRVSRCHLRGRFSRLAAFGIWTAAVTVMGATNVTLGTLEEGRAWNRVVGRVIANAVRGERTAVVSSGEFDDLYFFMLPPGIRIISLNRERNPQYGRDLSKWVQECAADGVLAEDLAFAAELGPRILIDEWKKLDRSGFDASVATVENFFPTRVDWEEACSELAVMRPDDPLAGSLRHFLALCGNALGCRMLEKGEVSGGDGRSANADEAWIVFKAIVDRIEPGNFAAQLNLLGMIRRGYPVSEAVAKDLARRRREIEKELGNWPQAILAAREGGVIHITSEETSEFRRGQLEKAEKRGPTGEQKRFLQTVSAAVKDPKHGKEAQSAIRAALRERKIRLESVGAQLVTLDLALGDIANAEKDAVDVLKLDRHDPTASAALGAIAASRGEYERAERYLRRAVETGRASVAAVNDLAYVCCRQGRFDEAETLAREVVKWNGGYWTFRETLASVLIRKGNLEEGERELVTAEELSVRAHIPKGTIASLKMDRAMLLKAKGDDAGFERMLRELREHKDLTPGQRKDLDALEQEAR